MAKLGIQKFSLVGDHNSARTTFSGTIELYLYYSSEKNFFYFRVEDLKTYLPEDVVPFHDGAFQHCDTKQKAIEFVEALIATQITTKRKLRVTLGMPYDLYMVENPVPKNPNIKFDFRQEKVIDPNLPKYLQDILNRGGIHEGRGLSLNVIRIMEVELNGKKLYAGCDKDWNWERKDLSAYSDNLMDWSPAVEQFLVNTQQSMDAICKDILNFFNAGDNVDALLDKMQSSNKLIG